MSKDDDILIDFSSEIDNEYFDAALVLANPFTDAERGLTSQFTQELPLKKACKYYRRILHLDEHDEDDEDEEDVVELFGQFQAKLEAFESAHASDETVPVSELASLVVENLIAVLQQHCMFEVRAYFSRDRDEIFIKLRATEHNLQVQADLDDYYLEFRPAEPREHEFQQVNPYGPYEMTPPKPFALFGHRIEDFYMKYDKEGNPTSDGSFFQYKDRVRLIHTTLHTTLDLGLLKNLGILLTYMPLHRAKPRTELKTFWGTFKKPFRRQNLQEIRLYFGEKIAIYFAWLEFLIYAMLVPAGIGLVLGILALAYNNAEDTDAGYTEGEVVSILVAIALPFFSVIYEQLWLRKEQELAWRWGTHDLYELEDQRPEFKGVYGRDPISGKIKKLRKSSEWYKMKKAMSAGVLVAFVICVLIAVVALFLYKATLKGDERGALYVGILNAIQIKVFNYIYKFVAVWLNKKQNYEFPSQYNDGLTVKLFMFQFVNSYTSLFYIAFAKGFYEGCEDDSCIGELQTQLATIFITNFCLNALEILTPVAMHRLKRYLEERKLRKLVEGGATMRTRLSAAEEQHKLSAYDTPLSDYMEVVISFGYVVLFSASFPLASTIFLILLYIELRVDAIKLCFLTQRPFPDYANTIGVWLYIVKFLVVVSAITNVAIIIFTTDSFELESEKAQWLTFLIIEHAIIAAKYIIASLIPDVPTVVRDGIDWTERVVDEKLYGKLTDPDKARRKRNLVFEEPAVEHPVIDGAGDIPFDDAK